MSSLYSAALLEHAERPRNATLPADPTATARGHNATCGDTLSVGVVVRGAIVVAVGFEAEACAVCVASSSVMTTAIEGGSPAAALDLAATFDRLVTTGVGPAPEALAPFAALARHPVRAGCALLPWQTLLRALAAPSPGAGSALDE